MAEYQTDPHIIEQTKHYDTNPISIVVDPGDGNVQIQIRNPAGVFFTPAAEMYTLTEADVYVIPMSNKPEMQIIATGTAQFYVIGAY
jgi:hypothetical protein